MENKFIYPVTYIITTLFFIFCITESCVALDIDPVDLISNACVFQGANSTIIRSGRAVIKKKTIVGGSLAKRVEEYSVVFDGNDFSGLKKQSVWNINPDDNTPEIGTYTEIVRTDGKKGGGNNIWYDRAAHLARVTPKNQGIVRFQDFGRAKGDVCYALTFLFGAGGGDSTTMTFTQELLGVLKKENAEQSYFTISDVIQEENSRAC